MSTDMEEGDQNGSSLKLPNGQMDCLDKVRMFHSDWDVQVPFVGLVNTDLLVATDVERPSSDVMKRTKG